MSPQYSLDRIALQDVMLNYAAAVDERDRARYKACFTEDMVAYNFGEQTLHGRDAFVAYVWQALKRYSSSQHLLGPQFAEVQGDHAITRSDVQALHIPIEDESRRIILWGTYNTEMKKIDGHWEISSHELIVRATQGY